MSHGLVLVLLKQWKSLHYGVCMQHRLDEEVPNRPRYGGTEPVLSFRSRWISLDASTQLEILGRLSGEVWRTIPLRSRPVRFCVMPKVSPRTNLAMKYCRRHSEWDFIVDIYRYC